MDIRRQKKAHVPHLRAGLLSAVMLAAMALTAFGLWHLKPAAPSVDRNTVLTGSVKRGQMLRNVRGVGALIPEEIRQIAAPVEGRVERKLVKPGDTVQAGTVLIELSNPALEQAAMDVEYQIKSAEAEMNNLRSRLEGERVAQQEWLTPAQSEYNQAKIQLDADEQLAKEGLAPVINLRIARARVEQLASRVDSEKMKFEANKSRAVAQLTGQLAVQQARIEQLRAQLRFNREQVASLQVRAGTYGVLQEVTVEVGQQVTPGANIARVADPRSLKATLQIPETQIKDIVLGQPAMIDTRGGGTVPGRVQRIDPAARNGTVTVDVRLEGPMPREARVDLSVDGTIELERLDDVLYVERSTAGQAGAAVGLFKLDAEGRSAARVNVKFGRASANTVEILEGLQAGDKVILSDMSQWDSVNRVELN